MKTAIDHIDGNPHNNDPANLRIVNLADNAHPEITDAVGKLQTLLRQLPRTPEESILLGNLTEFLFRTRGFAA